MDAAAISTPRVVQLIGRAVMLDLLRRKDVYVLVMMMLLFLLGVLSVNIVGIENASTATFLLNMGMTLACYAAHILTLLLTARQMPDEFENRTIYPLLAKPVSREDLVFGKWFACVGCGAGTMLVLLVLGAGPVPRMEPYATGTFVQAIALFPLSLALLTAMTLLLTLLLPKAVAIATGVLVFFAGHGIREIVEQGAATNPVLRPLGWVLAYVPDFSKLNLITRYTDGIAPLGGMEFVGLVVYALLFTGVCLVGASAVFRRRPL